VIPVKNETKKNRSRGYDDYGTVGGARQVMRVCGNIVGFTDAGCIQAKNWLENLVNEFDNDVGAKGGIIR